MSHITLSNKNIKCDKGQYVYIYYYHNDHLGTPQVLIDENGQIAWYADYESFGKVNILVERTTNNFRFPGQYYIEETGLYYNWWRWYEKDIARYLQKDLYYVQEQYVFVSNNPLIFVDPMGLKYRNEACDIFCNIICKDVNKYISCGTICFFLPAPWYGKVICGVICRPVIGVSCEKICFELCKDDDTEKKPDSNDKQDDENNKKKCLRLYK